MSEGVTAVLWPLAGALFGWDLALAASRVTLQAALAADDYVKAKAALLTLSLPDMAGGAVIVAAMGLTTIRRFVKPKAD